MTLRKKLWGCSLGKSQILRLFPRMEKLLWASSLETHSWCDRQAYTSHDGFLATSPHANPHILSILALWGIRARRNLPVNLPEEGTRHRVPCSRSRIEDLPSHLNSTLSHDLGMAFYIKCSLSTVQQLLKHLLRKCLFYL